MLLGEYQHSLDTKSRFIMPSKFRDRLGETFIITKGLNNCLFVFPLDEWQRLSEKIKQISITKAAPIQRFLFSGAVDVQPDKQGRILIPQHLKAYAVLDKDIVVTGCGSRAEIWNKENWDKITNDMSAEFVASVMDELDF